MASFDTHVNLLIGTVKIAPSPSTTGESLTLMPGDGDGFVANMPVTLYPDTVDIPSRDNSEIGYLRAVDHDQLTITRGAEDSIKMRVLPGWRVVASVTAKTFTDLEAAIATKADASAIPDVSGKADKSYVDARDAAVTNAAQSALAGHSSRTDNPHSVTKGQVGLGSADNTPDTAKPVSTPQAAALATKVDQVAGKGLSTNDYSTTEQTKLAGIAAGATQNASDAALRDRSTHTGSQAISTVSGLQTALDGKTSPADVSTAISSVIDAAPGTLDTLNELAAALGDDPNFAATVTSQIAAKADATALTAHASNTSNPHAVTKTQVGLGNADNTSDVNKPVSTAAQSAFSNKTAIGIGKSAPADIVTTAYSNDTDAINAAITLATITGVRAIRLLGASGTIYTVGYGTIAVPSDFRIETQPGVLVKLRSNSSGNNPVAFTNSDTTNGNSNIVIVGLNGDGNGANQLTGQSVGGVFFNFSGVQGLRYERVRVANSVRYNSFVGTVNGGTIAGTLTLTVDSTTVTGSGTSFTTQISPGQRIRAASGSLSYPVLRVISDTQLVLAEGWQYTSETSSTNYWVKGVAWAASDSYFGKTFQDDTFGGGGWDNCRFTNLEFESAAGYGFGTTGMYNSDCVNLQAKSCQNGWGLERVGHSRFLGGFVSDNVSKGVNLINGSHGNQFINVAATGNADGIYDSTTSTTRGRNSKNVFIGCKSFLNQRHGFLVEGDLRLTLSNCEAYDNNQGGTTGYGFLLQSASGYNTSYPQLRGCRGYDTQATRTQTRDIYINTGCDNADVDYKYFDLVGGPSMPTYAPNQKVANGAQISITSSAARKINAFETLVYNNQTTYQFELPRLDSIVDGHRVRFIHNGTGTSLSWSWIRSASDSFGVIEDYTALAQPLGFAVEFLWDNPNKIWHVFNVNPNASLALREPVIAPGTVAQYMRGDKSFQNLNQDVVPDGVTNRAYSATDKNKLAGIASGATANSTDAQLRDRSTHSGTQPASTISDFVAAADARISAAAGVSLATLTGGLIPTAQIPAIALTTVQTASSQSAMLALTTQEGDVVVRTDENKTYVKNSGTAGTMADFTLLNTPTDLVTSVNGQTGTVVLGKSDVGLANVDNTSDANKPVSTATATALAAKANDSTAAHLAGVETFSGTKTFGADVTLSDAVNVPVGSTTGTKIGTSPTQKLALFGATPVVQQAATTDIATALANLGLRASGTAWSATTSGTMNFTGLVVLNNMRRELAVSRNSNVAFTSTTASNSEYDVSTASRTATLPAPTAATAGNIYEFIKVDSSANTLTIATASGTINGAATYVLTAQFKYVKLRINAAGTDYLIVGNN